MNEKEKLIPQRRFKEFKNAGTWEQRKLKELTEVITKGTTPKDKSGKGSINFVKVENINKSSGEIDIKSKITENEHEGYLKRSQLKDGDILFSIAGTLGRTAIVKKELLPANTNQALAIIRLDEGDKNYITTFLNGRAAEDFIKKNPTVGAQPNLSLEQVGNLLIEIPSLEEQTKIGSFFKQLDDTIALHQRKLDKSKQLKLSYLSEMFPVEGECKPKRRFIGFTDDWEQRKLIDVCSIITKQTGFDYSATIKPSLIRSKMANTYPFIQNKDFSGFNINTNTDFFIPTSIAEKFPKIILDVPSLLVTISGNIGNVGFYDKKDRSFIGGAVGICKLKDPEQGAFIIYELESEFGQKQFKRTTKTSSHANITVETIKNLNILFPKNHSEYIKIGSFFKRLDETIALHQHKLEKLKNIKQAYLNEMFV